MADALRGLLRQVVRCRALVVDYSGSGGNGLVWISVAGIETDAIQPPLRKTSSPKDSKMSNPDVDASLAKSSKRDTTKDFNLTSEQKRRAPSRGAAMRRLRLLCLRRRVRRARSLLARAGAVHDWFRHPRKATMTTMTTKTTAKHRNLATWRQAVP
ncbi:hypothetical protein PG990_010494 [Apiospora arundinis]